MKAVHLSPSGVSTYHIYVSIKKTSIGQGKLAALCLVLTLSLSALGYAQEGRFAKYPDHPIRQCRSVYAGDIKII